VGRDGFEQMCIQNLRGEEKGKPRQQATGDRFGIVHGEKDEK